MDQSPTSSQLNSRLNPTPFQVQLPTAGLFKMAGDTGIGGPGSIFLADGNGNYTGYYLPTGGSTQAEGRAIQLNYLKNLGIDYNSLPSFDPSYVQRTGNLTYSQDPNALTSVARNLAQTNNVTVNNTPNTLSPNAVTPVNNQNPTTISGGTSTPASVQPPQVNLQPGMTGDSVKQLQDYLVSQGLMTQDQVNTGYGTYGPQTTAAVAKLQQALGVNNSSGVGYFGPQTMQALSSYTGGSSSGGSTGGTPDGTGNPDLSGLPPEFQDLYSQLETYLQKLQANGQVLNPNIQIDPTTAASFLTQAHSEIDPYYSGQLNLATDALSNSINYATGTETNTEKDLGTQYGNDLSTLQGNEADKGFAQSGERNKAETDLATKTQNTIDEGRRTLAYNAGNVASTYAQKYGSASLPSFSIGASPKVVAGESNFDTTGGSSPLYTLSPSVYDGLTGSEQYNQTADVANRASQLEDAFRSSQGINQERALTL